MHGNGYYPIIITRQWNNKQIDTTDKLKKNYLEIERTELYEIHRLKYKRSIRDTLSDYPFLNFPQKFLTFCESLFSNFFLKSIPFNNFYSYSKELIKKQNDILGVIASGSPFQSFFIGYKLKNKFKHILWIPDYRDEWTTRITNKPNTFLEKILFHFSSLSEKKWTSNADFFLTVTEKFKENIEAKVNKKGYVISNGHNFESIKKINKNPLSFKFKKNNLAIVYIGTIYSYQNIEVFINSIKNLTKSNNNIVVFFIGIESVKKELERIKGLTKGYEKIFKIIKKLDKRELGEYLQFCDVALTTKYGDLKGCLPVKIFDYYYFKLPILLCPSDKDLIEKFILENEAGFIANNEPECQQILERLILEKKKGIRIPKLKTKNLYKYKRSYQTKLLAEILNSSTKKS